MSSIKRAAAVASVCVGMCGPCLLPAAAQDYERIAPKEPPLAAPSPAPIPPVPPAAGGAQANRMILNQLRGIRLLDSRAKLVASGSTEPGITFDGLPALDTPQIRDTLAPFLGKSLNFAGLTDIARAIVAWYREQGRPFVDVAFPEQDVTGGVVQAVITEFRVGEIKVQNNNWFSADLLRGEMRLAPGDVIAASRLQADLDWLNQNPFRNVVALAQKGEAPGTTDLVLDATDRLPLRVYGGYDNTGTPILGHDRWNLGFNWGNALWLDHQLSYQLTTSNDFWHPHEHNAGPDNPTFIGHSANYAIPLPWHDRILIFGSYERAVPRLGSSLGLVGVSGQASIRYAITLPPLKFLTHELQVGYDFKTSNNNLEFGGVAVSNVTSEIDQFPVSYHGTLTDDFGQTTLDNMLVMSPGNLTAQNKDALFQAQANNTTAKARYIYDRLTLTRATRLPYEASWVMRLIAQTSDRNLLPSEQLNGGGFDSVRGYDERAASGSLGLLLRQELRSPPFALAKARLADEIDDQAQLLAFWDYGSLREKQIAPGAPSSAELQSVGVGLRYTIRRYLEMRLDYGWQLRPLPGTTMRSQMAQLAITVSY